MSKLDKFSDAELELILAQNRTTHAVRAFVRFLFIQLSGLTIAALLLTLGASASGSYSCQMNNECGASTFFYFTGVLTALIAIIWSSSAGWKELSKSQMPEHFNVSVEPETY